jgi:glycosyltransferase involved in cell wall biosynthesis
VVHFHDLRFALTTGVVGASLARRPALFHTHGLIFHSGSASKWKRLAIRFYFGPLLRLGRVQSVASSEADRALLLRDAPYLNARTTTCPNAIPLSPLSSIARNPVPGRVVSIGRIVVNKSLSNLIRALARIDDVDWSLVLAGQPDPAELSRIETEIDDLGVSERVTFVLDFAEDALRPLLASAALAAFPSKGEGFGISLLEAMAAGVPVVANRIPAHEALLGEDLADQLVDFENPDVASLAVRTVLGANEGELDALSERLRSRAADYDIGRLKKQIDELYEKLGVRSHARHR